jgi:hypothetical protein
VERVPISRYGPTGVQQEVSSPPVSAGTTVLTEVEDGRRYPNNSIDSLNFDDEKSSQPVGSPDRGGLVADTGWSLEGSNNWDARGRMLLGPQPMDSNVARTQVRFTAVGKKLFTVGSKERRQ